MRKIGWWLLPTLFLFVLGCGGGEQATTSGGGTTGGEPALPAGYGLIKLTIHQGNTGAPVVGPRALAPSGPLPAADNVRIAARLVRTQTVPETDPDTGVPTGNLITFTSEVYRKIVDVSLPVPPPSTVSIAVPAAPGYVVEVVSSKLAAVGSDNVHILLKYGKSDPVDVTAGVESTATITATPIADGLTITLPDNVIAGDRYTFPVAIDNVPLRGSFFMNQSVDNVNNSTPPTTFVSDNSSRSASFTAQTLTTLPPGGADHWDLYIQGLFYMDPTWQSSTESGNWYKKFVFYYPNRVAGWTDPYLTTPLYPLGTVNITVNLSPSR